MKGLVLAALLGVLFFSGCDSPASVILGISGHYEGSLTTYLNGTDNQTPVGMDCSQPASAKAAATPQYVIRDMSGATLLELWIADPRGQTLSVRSSRLLTQPTSLKFDSKQGCYAGKSDSRNGFAVTLCASAPEISFQIDDSKGAPVLSLVLYRFSGATDPGTKEKPRAFTLTEAIERARNMSFQAKIEFEHVIQAKEQANAAYLHLLPQVTLGGAAGGLAPSFSSALAAIDDLAPFLLPSRWLNAHQASDQSRAEEDAARIMKLDMASQVEGLFYSYDRDRRSLAVYTSAALKIDALHAQIQRLEAAGELPMGSADNVASVQQDLHRSMNVFRQVLAEDLAAISQSLGFYSPLTVQDARIDQEPYPIDNAPSVDFQTINEAALARSFELDQMDWLISAAKLAKVAEFFDWLDPAGDPNLGLGAALPSQIRVAQSRLNELGVDRDELQSIISENAFNAVTDYNEALKSYALERANAVLQARRFNETLAQLNAGVKVEIPTLLDILKDSISARIRIEEARADYRVARSEIDRLLLQGDYARF